MSSLKCGESIHGVPRLFQGVGEQNQQRSTFVVRPRHPWELGLVLAGSCRGWGWGWGEGQCETGEAQLGAVTAVMSAACRTLGQVVCSPSTSIKAEHSRNLGDPQVLHQDRGHQG